MFRLAEVTAAEQVEVVDDVIQVIQRPVSGVLGCGVKPMVLFRCVFVHCGQLTQTGNLTRRNLQQILDLTFVASLF